MDLIVATEKHAHSQSFEHLTSHPSTPTRTPLHELYVYVQPQRVGFSATLVKELGTESKSGVGFRQNCGDVPYGV